MVSLIFKTVYLFLALFTLPQILAAPGAAAVDLHSRDDTPEYMLDLHNQLRKAINSPPLTWNAALAGTARLQVATCIKKEIPRVIELVSTEDSFFLALLGWLSRKDQAPYQIFSNTVKQVGCASGTCDGSSLYVCMYDSK